MLLNPTLHEIFCCLLKVQIVHPVKVDYWHGICDIHAFIQFVLSIVQNSFSVFVLHLSRKPQAARNVFYSVMVSLF